MQGSDVEIGISHSAGPRWPRRPGRPPRPPPVRHGAGGHAASVDVRRRVCVRGPRATKFARHLGSPCAPPNGTHSAISSRGARPTHLANASAACNPTDVPGGGGAERGLEVAGRFFMRFSFCGLGSGAAGDVTVMEAHLIWVLGLDFVKRVPQVPIQKEGFRFPSASWGASACFPEKTGKKHRATGGGGAGSRAQAGGWTVRSGHPHACAGPGASLAEGQGGAQECHRR